MGLCTFTLAAAMEAGGVGPVPLVSHVVRGGGGRGGGAPLFFGRKFALPQTAITQGTAAPALTVIASEPFAEPTLVSFLR